MSRPFPILLFVLAALVLLATPKAAAECYGQVNVVLHNCCGTGYYAYITICQGTGGADCQLGPTKKCGGLSNCWYFSAESCGGNGPLGKLPARREINASGAKLHRVFAHCATPDGNQKLEPKSLTLSSSGAGR